jgi:hypothetical protein
MYFSYPVTDLDILIGIGFAFTAADKVSLPREDQVSEKPIADEQIEKIASEITRYLQQHQFAADTLEGICHWWITRQRIEEDKKRVLAALEYLVDNKQLNCRQLPDGTILYSGTTTDSTPDDSLH